MTTFFQEVTAMDSPSVTLEHSSTMDTVNSFITALNKGNMCLYCGFPVEYQFNQQILKNIHKRRKCQDCGLVFRSFCEIISDISIHLELPNYNTDQMFCNHVKLKYQDHQENFHECKKDEDTKKCVGIKLSIEYLDKNFFHGCKQLTCASILLYDMAEFVNHEKDGNTVELLFSKMKRKRVSANYLLELLDKSKNSIPDLIRTFMARKRGKRGGCNRSDGNRNKAEKVSSNSCKTKKI